MQLSRPDVNDLPADKTEHEDVVVEALIGTLRSAGENVRLLERPDRLQRSERCYADLTTDALIEINSCQWSIDVMSLAAPGSHGTVPIALQNCVDSIASDCEVLLYLQGESPSIDRVGAVCGALRRAVEAEPSSGRWDQDDIEAVWRRVDGEEQPSGCMAILMESPSAEIQEQIAATLARPLRRKGAIQAAPASSAGCRSAVVIDWAGHQGIQQGTHWLSSSPLTVKAAVDSVLDGEQTLLDAVVLRDRIGGWHLLWGSFPLESSKPV